MPVLHCGSEMLMSCAFGERSFIGMLEASFDFRFRACDQKNLHSLSKERPCDRTALGVKRSDHLQASGAWRARAQKRAGCR